MTQAKRMTTAQICATIVDRKSEHYGYVASIWGKEWAETCRRHTLLDNLGFGETLFNRGTPGTYGERFPDLVPIALELANEQGLTNARLGANDRFHLDTDQGKYFLLNTDVRYANGGHDVSYHGTFHLVKDPS